MAANVNPGIPMVPIPQQLFHLPFGTYGISFDLRVGNMMNLPPYGWGLQSKSRIYSGISRELTELGYTHPQGSVYQNPNYIAVLAFVDAHMLRHLTPLGIFPTVLKNLQLFHIPADAFLLTNELCLGGPSSPVPSGPTPTRLIPPGVPYAQLQGLLPLPVGVQDIPETRNAQNWGQ